ncbi:MAG: hypothetical protein LAP13_07880 [Acidobacteriia bacterium]|nr:hypothetical protein [Terriglobia bacterium]
MKKFTREQVKSRKEKAVQFAEDVLNDPELARQIEDETVDEYAAHRHIQIANPPSRSRTMPTRRSKVEQELQDSQETLDDIASLVDEALDAELSREEVIAKLKEMQELLPEEEEPEPEPAETD